MFKEIVLRDYQEKNRQEIYKAIKEGSKSILLKAPTAYGKTVLAAKIIHDIQSKSDRRIFFIAPTITLVTQSAEEFTSFDLDVSIIQANNPEQDFSKQIQICSVQSLASLYKRFPDRMKDYFKGGIVINDECHVKYKVITDIIESDIHLLLGLSATPYSKGLGRLYETLIRGGSTSELIKRGALSKFEIYSHDEPDMRGVRVNPSGDYSYRESGEKYTPKVRGNVVKTWEKLAKGKKTILFAPRVVDAEKFASDFIEAGYKAVAVSGNMDETLCKQAIKDFEEGKYDIICSINMLIAGFNVPSVEVCLDCQPTKSIILYLQKIGRILRVFRPLSIAYESYKEKSKHKNKVVFLIKSITDENKVIEQLVEIHDGNVLTENSMDIAGKGDIVISNKPYLFDSDWEVFHDLRPDKKLAMVLDHAGNALRLGLPTDRFPETLHMGHDGEQPLDRKNAADPLPSKCPKCSTVKQAGVKICPKCQFEPVHVPKPSTLKVEDGELVAIGKKQGPTNEQKLSFHKELKGYAIEKGKTNDWIKKVYTKKFKEAPVAKVTNGTAPGKEVLGYIKYFNIANSYRFGKKRRG